MLNRTEISRNERRDYEMFYLKQFSNEFYLSGGTEDPSEEKLSEDFLNKHPHFINLVKG